MRTDLTIDALTAARRARGSLAGGDLSLRSRRAQCTSKTLVACRTASVSQSMSKVERLRQRPGRVVQHHALKRETQQDRRAFTDEHEARLTALRWLHHYNTIRCRSRLGQQPPITHDHSRAKSTTVASPHEPRVQDPGARPNSHPAQKPQPAHHSPRPLPARPIQEPQTRPPTTARLPNAKAHPTARPEATVSPPVADLVERHGRVDGQIKATPQRAHPNPPAAEAITGPPVTKAPPARRNRDAEPSGDHVHWPRDQRRDPRYGSGSQRADADDAKRRPDSRRCREARRG